MTDHTKSEMQLSVGLARKFRNQTEKDYSLLENRINLLKKEELKTKKKIQDTQRKANSILETKQRNEERHQNVKTLASHSHQIITKSSQASRT